MAKNTTPTAKAKADIDFENELWNAAIELLNQKLNHIHQNPVQASICYTAEEYVYSSAGQYAAQETLLE